MTLKDIPDSLLVARLLKGDKTAFEALYLRYFRRIFAFIRARIREQDAARDLTQDVFLRFWQARHRIDINRSLESYLFQSARNAIINYLRHESVKKNSVHTVIHNPHVDGPDDVFDVEMHIARLIKNLPPDIRKVFMASRFEHLSYAEIAHRHSITVKQVEKRMGKALAQLRADYKALNK
ncbi:RNA polymerase sigma-70 factor [bacterium]|nr:RNA polymerase sigma-70 factor [bacterium]